MFLRLKVLVYYIKIGPAYILESSLDYNLYVLPIYIGLDYILLLFLG